MRSRIEIVQEISFQNPFEMPLSEHDDVVRALPTGIAIHSDCEEDLGCPSGTFSMFPAVNASSFARRAARTLRTDERRALGAANRKVTFAPLAAERQSR
jgi:hypothetical protein